MTFEAQTRKNKLLDDIAQIDAALAKGDSVLTDTYNKLKNEKEIEILLIDKLLKPVEEPTLQIDPMLACDSLNPLAITELNGVLVIPYPCINCGKICKSNAGLVTHQKKCKVDTKLN